MKKLIIVVACFFVLLTAGVFVWTSGLFSGTNDQEITQASVSLADVVVKFRHGVDGIGGFESKQGKYLSPEVVTKLSKYVNDLKATNNAKFEVSKYYADNYNTKEEVQGSDVGGGASANDGSKSNVIINTPTVQTVQQDKRIIQENGSDYIPVNSLNFTNGVTDTVAYKGIYMIVKKEKVPVTYDMMVKDPNNFFKYVAHKFVKQSDKNFVDVQFQSVNSGHNILVRVYSIGGKIIDFKVTV